MFLKVSIALGKEHLAPVMTLLLGLVVLQNGDIKQNGVPFAFTIKTFLLETGVSSRGYFRYELTILLSTSS